MHSNAPPMTKGKTPQGFARILSSFRHWWGIGVHSSFPSRWGIRHLLKYRLTRPRPGPRRMADVAFQQCIDPRCGATADLSDTAFRCPRCGELLDVAYEWDRLSVP